MYKLYDMYIKKLLDASYNEKEIIETLGELIKENINFRYIIIKHDERLKMDEVYKGINSVGDYYDYVRDYQRRVLKEEKSCLELKKEILDRQENKNIAKRR